MMAVAAAASVPSSSTLTKASCTTSAMLKPLGDSPLKSALPERAKLEADVHQGVAEHEPAARFELRQGDVELVDGEGVQVRGKRACTEGGLERRQGTLGRHEHDHRQLAVAVAEPDHLNAVDLARAR